MIKHFTTLYFIGSIFWACEDSNTDYIDCKWFVYAGWQETDPNCSYYRQYVLNDSVGIPGYEYNSSVGFGGGIVNVDNFIQNYFLKSSSLVVLLLII